MHVDLVFDPICPWCYIGLRRFWRVRDTYEGLTTETTYRAYELNPDTPIGGWDRTDFLKHKFGGVRLAQHLFEAVKRAGLREQIFFDFDAIKVTPPTLDAHRLVKWSVTLGGSADHVVESLFFRYFSAGEDIGRHDVLVDIARSCGMDWRKVGDLLNSDADVDTVLTENQMARHIGVRGVPFFIFDHRFSITGVEEPQVFVEAMNISLRAALPTLSPISFEADILSAAQ